MVLESYLTLCSAAIELGGEPTITKTPQTLTVLNICLYTPIGIALTLIKEAFVCHRQSHYIKPQPVYKQNCGAQSQWISL